MSETVTIKDVQVITTQPSRARLVIVKLITSEPGLYGLGCATFTQRFHAVVTAIEKHLKPFLIGRDVSRIEEIWQMAMVHSYFEEARREIFEILVWKPIPGRFRRSQANATHSSLEMTRKPSTA